MEKPLRLLHIFFYIDLRHLPVTIVNCNSHKKKTFLSAKHAELPVLI